MQLKSPHSDFHLDTINLIQRSAVRDLEVVLTNLWLRVLHDNRKVRSANPTTLSAELALSVVSDPASLFKGFPDVGPADAWLRAEALVMLRSPKRAGEFVVARPVHERATRIRHTKEADDKGMSGVVYGWLSHSRPDLIPRLKEFLAVGADDSDQDLATHALWLLGEGLGRDLPISEPRPPASPICSRLGENYADDIERLLAYSTVMPRVALVGHLARITGLYVGLYLLTTFRAVVELEQSGGEKTCDRCMGASSGECRFAPSLVVDSSERTGTDVTYIAETSWRSHEDQLLAYLESHIRLKKFHEFAERNNKNPYTDHIPVTDIEQLTASAKSAQYATEKANWALDRLANIKEGLEDPAEAAQFEELREYFDSLLGDPFDTYAALIGQVWATRWHNYYLQVLDYVFAGRKNADGLVHQPIGGSRRRRRAVLGPQTVETLAMVLLLRKTEDGWQPTPMRVDELVDAIAERYGLLINRLPGELAADPTVAPALSANLHRFKLRLREAGLFRDLSDAYLAQTVTPRFQRLDGK